MIGTENGGRSSEIHIYRVFWGKWLSNIERFARTLSLDEMARADRARLDRVRGRFITGRGVLRQILAYHSRIPASQLKFTYGRNGKPRLAQSRSNTIPQFSMSYSEELIVYAISADREIGIDLERIRPIPEASQIAKYFLSLREQNVLQALPENEKFAVFLDYWTRKEALLKATGEGLTGSLDQFEVPFDLGQRSTRVTLRNDCGEVLRLCLQPLFPAPGYTGAVALAGDITSILGWEWNESSAQF
jgi:4'-phosphopantetheinyl transferase